MARFYVVITEDDLQALIDDFGRRKIDLDVAAQEAYYFETLAIPFQSTIPEVEVLKADLVEEGIYFLDENREPLLD